MYQNLSKYYDQLFPLDENLISKMERYVKKDDFAIDLGCGTGRLTKIIFDHQMNVTGIDLNSEMIRYASKKYPQIKFIEKDMIDALEGQYHLITCFGNTLPHLNQENLIRFLSKVKEKLDSNGYMIIEMLNYDKILKEKPANLMPIEVNGIHFSRLYTYSEDSIYFTTILKINQKTLTGSTTLYPYTYQQLNQWISQSGLHVDVYGDLDQTALKETDGHFYIIVTQL